MKIFIDTAKLDEIEQAFSYGILDGVTTNPSLIKKAVEGLKKKGEKVDMEGYIVKLLKAARGTPVSLEVVGIAYKDMVKEGKSLFKQFNHVANNVCIKIPVNPTFKETDTTMFDGIKAVKELSSAGILVNCTLIFTPEQALMAAKAGAKFVSPFVGRIDDSLRAKAGMKFNKEDYFPAEGLEKDGKIINDNGIVSGVDLVRKCCQILKIYNLKTGVIAASIRNARQFRECALAGAEIATLPSYVIKESLDHFKTMEGMKLFTDDIIPEYSSIVRK